MAWKSSLAAGAPVCGSTSGSAGRQVEKLIGADVEFGNCISGARPPTGQLASRMVLGEVRGINRNAPNLVQDSLRKFLPCNGGCAYIDLDHIEFPIPEVTNALDFVAVWHATLQIARQAMLRANRKLGAGQQLNVFANNSDGLGHSYGSHCNVLMTREAFADIFGRRIHYLLFLAAHQASSIVYTGQGKVGAENGAPQVPYQLSQRADFFETLTGIQTTFKRPIVNSRDEPLCGPLLGSDGVAQNLARLHVIFYDSNLCHVACYLKIGTLQIVTAMIEAGDIDVRLILDDPVDAVVRWSHDPTLQSRARLADGRCLTAVEHQQLLQEKARQFVERGGCDGIVPGAPHIVTLWGDILDKLAAKDLSRLAGSLDWLLKLVVVERALANHDHLDWGAPELKQLDHLYSSLDPATGLYWMHEQAGVAERLVPQTRIEQFMHEPPDDTRAWTRAQLLRAAGAARIAHVDWDRITFRLNGGYGRPRYHVLWMRDPRQWARRDTENLFQKRLPLEQLVASLRELAGPVNETASPFCTTSGMTRQANSQHKQSFNS